MSVLTEEDVVAVPLEQAFRAAMGSVAAAVSVVTTMESGVPYGSTVSAFGSLSMAPPMMFVSLDNRSSLLARLRPSRVLAVNVLAAHHDRLARQFAQRGIDKFAGVSWIPICGAPALEDRHALVSLRVDRLVRAGDHTIVLAHVLAAEASAGAPLVYWRQTYGTHRAL